MKIKAHQFKFEYDSRRLNARSNLYESNNKKKEEKKEWLSYTQIKLLVDEVA